jgi:hypothetical protein
VETHAFGFGLPTKRPKESVLLVRIDYLKNNPVYASRLAELCGAEWQHLYSGWNQNSALANSNRSGLMAPSRSPLSRSSMANC